MSYEAQASRAASICEMYATGKSAKEVADAFGTHRNYVYGTLRSLGVEMRRKGNRGLKASEKMQAAVDLFFAGKSFAEIGAALGFSRQRAQQLLKRVGYTAADNPSRKLSKERKKQAKAAKEQRCIDRYGVPIDQWRDLVKRGVIAAYRSQKNNCTQQGYGFDLCFKDWWAVWQESGKFDERGRFSGGYVLGRKDKSKPFTLGNVVIQTLKDNSYQTQIQHRESA